MCRTFLKKHGMSITVLVTLILLQHPVRTATHLGGAENKSGSMKKGKVLYDVSSLIHSDSERSNERDALSKVYSQVEDTMHFYYETKADTYERTCDEKYDSLGSYPVNSCGIKYALRNISIIFGTKVSRRDLLSISSTLTPFRNGSVVKLLESSSSSFLESVSMSLDYHSSDCHCSSEIKKITDYFEMVQQNITKARLKQGAIQLGLELNQNFLTCCYQQQFFLLGKVDHIILRIELTPLTTMLSYGLFSLMMDDVVEKYQTYVQKWTPGCKVYIRLVNKNWKDSVAKTNFIYYEALVSKFVHAWLSQEKDSDLLFIIPPRHKDVAISGNSLFIKEKLMPEIYVTQNSVAESKEIVKWMHSVFNTVLLVNPSLEMLKHILSGTDASSSIMFTYGGRDLREAINIIKYVGNASTTLNIRAIYLDYGHFENQNMKPALNKLHSKNITIGCFKNTFSNNLQGNFEKEIRDFVQTNYVSGCCSHFNTSQVLIKISIKIPNEENLIKFLSHLQKTKTFHEKMRPGKTFIASIAVESVGEGESYFDVKNSIVPHSFYCNEKLKLVNEYYQTILSFASIHGWSGLVLKPLSKHQSDFGFWKNIETEVEINRTLTAFPVLVRSNAEKSMDKSLPMTFDCIEWTQQVGQGGIEFMENTYAGATFDAKLKLHSQLESKELQTLLHFVLAKFYFVEITGVEVQMLKQISGVVTETALENMKRFRSLPSSLVYIEMPLQDGANPGKHEIFSKTFQNYISVHMSGWESLSEMELNTRFRNVISSAPRFSINYGITVQNCSHEMNLGLARLKKLPFMKSVGYLVCNVKPVAIGYFNQSWMEQFFGTLFYTKTFMEHSLSTESIKKKVIFRINLISVEGRCNEKRDTSLLLSFLNGLNQFSANYQIKYFIVRAFEKENVGQKCPISWWRLNNYSDLTNVSAYVDIEKEFFGQPTILPIPLPQPEIITNQRKDEDASTHWGIYILIGVLNVGALVLIILFVLWLQRRSNKNKLLTRKEVNSFYNGIQVRRKSMELVDSDYIDTTIMKFPREHEMSAKDIQIQDVVGRGEFGVVHKGLYQNRVEIAIKIPKLDCGKDHFKSALSELKILCYVGSHPNIVSFLGAYTKEISKGKLLIVTEFCGKGSLESYLRCLQQAQLQQQTIGDDNCTLNLNQLYGFSHQIASGMEYVAQKRIIHGDLATRNVLLTCDFTCKISDFGLSRRIYEQGLYIKKGNEALPWMWMAPESLNFMEFTIKSDVWSFGVTLWEIFSLGKMPCPGMYLSDDYIMNLERGVRMGRAQFASEPLHQKMLNCWSLAQEERPTFSELKQYFANLGGHSYQNTSLV